MKINTESPGIGRFCTPAITLFSILLAYSVSGHADLNPDQIMEKAHHMMLYQGDSMRMRTRMVTVDKNGNKRKRQFIGLRLDKPSDVQAADRGYGDQLYYLYFRRPGDIKDTAFLVHKKSDGNDDRWMYLPALDLVKRISAGDKRTSFVGSTFFYEDISGRNLAADTHTVVETSNDYYVLKSVPKVADDVEFSYYKTWIHRASFIPVSIEYYDKSGVKYRLFENLKVENIEGKSTVVQGRMTNLITNEVTEVSSSRITYSKKLTEDIFSERYLRNPPAVLFK